MNTAPLKRYAPAARNAFIAAVTAQAAKVGITADGAAPAKVQGDVMLVGGHAFPARLSRARTELQAQVARNGFAATMEAAAYTWFNRFAAIRYMEVHGFLGHGHRVLSDADGGPGRPEILDHAADVDLPGLDQQRAIDLKLAGDKDAELYRLLILAQCDALHRAMPFLFDRIGHATELLMPANLLHTDSLTRQMVAELPDALWQDIEVVGWLYQFYISEKKDQVIGKKVASEDIPAATQLFTPNWIVKYLVQNSLGAQWLATYPQSSLKEAMEYYIEPAEQTAEVQAQLDAMTPDSLTPEALTLIDPACGSGHILVEAYELFKAIYLERGYRLRDVPALVLTKNLYGLDIDRRAAQLTGFALMMKGRADDRRLFERDVALNVLAFENSDGLDVDALARGVTLSDYGLTKGDVTELEDLFEHATTFGSLIQVPKGLAGKLEGLRRLADTESQDLFVQKALQRLRVLVRQAEVVASRYDAVVANPPYLSEKNLHQAAKKSLKDRFPNSRFNLYSTFIERGLGLTDNGGRAGILALQSWMSGTKYADFRLAIIDSCIIHSMAHMGAGAFDSIGGQVVSTAATILGRASCREHQGTYVDLTSTEGEHSMSAQVVRVAGGTSPKSRYNLAQSTFTDIPGSPIVYWATEADRAAFRHHRGLGEIADFRQGMATTDNDRFLRRWSEISFSRVSFEVNTHEDPKLKGWEWFPYNKGGGDKRWYGHNDYVVNYEDGGEVLIELVRGKYPRISDPEFVIKNRAYYFLPSVTYSALSDGDFAARLCGSGFIFDTKGSCVFPTADASRHEITAFLNSRVASGFLGLLAPTLDFNLFALKSIPVLESLPRGVGDVASALEGIATVDWDASELSWGFQSLPFLTASNAPNRTLAASYATWTAANRATIAEMKRLEEENNRLFIDAYGLQDELSPEVPLDQITLTVNPAYRYGGKLTEDEQWTRFRQDTMEELVSYAIGCMMGRYSLDQPGLVYAHAGNQGFDPSKYTTFPADDDGIVPLTDTEWFEDDACNRVVEFLSVAWPKEHLEDNLAFLAENLGPKRNESSRETLRRWLCDKFFRDHHLKRYKKRPIYWLFTSGRNKAFQCLVYLHRYNEGTLARMRAEYVIPLQGKMAARIDKLKGDIDAATSSAATKRLQKEHDSLEKQLVELVAFDEKLRHYADRRITLDLDDGVKVNYGRFGSLLDQAKAIHGKQPEGP